MGLSESKVIADALSEACRKAENTGKIDVAALLSEQEFMKSLREVWTHVPERTRRSIGRRRQTTGQRGSRVGLRKPAISKITVSPTLMASAPNWSRNPSSFFIDESMRLDLKNSPVAEAYLCLEQLGRRGEVDIIRTRLLKIVFYRLKERLCLHYMRSNDVDDMAKIILKSGLVQCESDKVKGNIVRWTDQGGRIDALCRSIGGSSTNEDSHLGNLFCLPQEYHDEFIRLLGYTGPEREQQIQQIKDRGILNVQDRAVLDSVAAGVFGFLWTKIKVSINDIVVETPESVFGQNLQHRQCFWMEQPPVGVQRRSVCSTAPIDSATLSVNSRRRSQEQSIPHPNDETGQAAFDFVLEDNSHQLLPETFGSRDEAAITSMGSIFNIHENPQTMLPDSFDLQNEAAIMSLERVFNIHANSQIMLPGPFDLQNEAAITSPGSIFNIHEHPQSTLPLQSPGLQDEQAMTVAEASMNSSMDLQSHHSQYRTSVPLIATHSDYRQNHSDQATTPILVN